MFGVFRRWKPKGQMYNIRCFQCRSVASILRHQFAENVCNCGCAAKVSLSVVTEE
jgi:hypothetical protein